MKEMKKCISSLLFAILLTMSVTSSYAATVKLNNTSITLVKGNSYKLKLTGTSKKKYWSSGNKSVATVSSTGKVKAKKAGTCYITVKYGKKKKKCKVKVVSSSSSASISASNNSQTFETTHDGNIYDSDGNKMGTYSESNWVDD